MNARTEWKLSVIQITRVVLLANCAVLLGGCSDSPEPAATVPNTVASKSNEAAPTKAPAQTADATGSKPEQPDFFETEEVIVLNPGLPGLAGTASPESDSLASEGNSRPPLENPLLTGESAASVEPSSGPQQTSEVPPAATVHAAMELLDLRKLPRLPEAKATTDSPTQVSLTVKASVAEAKKFYTELLEQAGWKLVPPEMAIANSEDYGQVNFAQAGYILGISLYKFPDTGLLSVGLNNYGNIDARKLPQPAGSEPLYSSFNLAMYVTDEKVPLVAAACVEQLQSAGWQPYIHPFTAYTEDAQQRSLSFKQNGISLSAYIALAPAQMNRTTVQYSLHMLGDELPVPADATKIQFLESPLQLSCETKDEILATLQFYRKKLALRGWKEKGTGNQNAGEAISVFQRSEGLPVVLKITRLGEEVPTSVAIAEFQMPREVPVETAKNNPQPQPTVDTPSVDFGDLLPAGLMGLLTYEDWLKKNKYKPSAERLQQYAAEMEKLANSLGEVPTDEGDTKTPEPSPEKPANADASVAAMEAIVKAEGRVQTDDDGILTFVELSSTDFSDKQMKLLAGMSEVTYLNLSFTQVTDAGLAVVSGMPKLEKLYLSGLKISDAGLKVVAGHTELDLLIVSQTPITDAGLLHLKTLANLERLSLMETKITDKGLAALLDLKKLKALDLANTNITDKAIPQLVQLRNLEELNLSSTKISPAGIKTLQAALPDCDINH